MLGLLLSPFIVMFLLWLFARHEAELSYHIIFFVVAGVSLAAYLAAILVSPWLGLAVFLIGLPFLIARYCYVSLPKAALVTILFIVLQVGLRALLSVAFKAAMQPAS